jgi:hypothetical protein
MLLQRTAGGITHVEVQRQLILRVLGVWPRCYSAQPDLISTESVGAEGHEAAAASRSHMRSSKAGVRRTLVAYLLGPVLVASCRGCNAQTARAATKQRISTGTPRILQAAVEGMFSVTVIQLLGIQMQCEQDSRLAAVVMAAQL